MTGSIFTRRDFLAATSCVGAALALGKSWAVPALAESVAQDPRVAATPLVDRGFAAVRKVGEGTYATISDFSKGLQTLCNGGFLVGRDAALIIEAYHQPAGAAFALEALRMVSQAPVRAAVDTHYHYDHTLGNSYFGGQGIPVWAHAQAGPLMIENYAKIQGQDTAPILGPLEQRVRAATDDTRRQRAESDLNAFSLILQSVASTVVALPNHPLDPAKLPVSVDLGGLTAVIETYPGHTPTDLVIRVPEQNLTYAGDLLFNAWYPVTFDGEMSAWRRTLEAFAGFGSDALFVPGHGQVCGQEGIATSRAIFDDLAEQAGKFFRAGVPMEEAQQRYAVPEQFQGFPIFAWGLTVGSSIAKFYEEFKAGAR
jgi:cyclase